MSLLCARYCPVRCRSGPAASGPVTQPQHRLPAVRRSLAGLPVHRAEGEHRRASRSIDNTWLIVPTPAGGLLVVPVLTPSTDNIPFGLALSWQRLSSAAGAPSRHYAEQEDLYELQYVLDGEGEVKVHPNSSQHQLVPLPELQSDTCCVGACSCAQGLECCKALQLETAYWHQWAEHGVKLGLAPPVILQF